MSKHVVTAPGGRCVEVGAQVTFEGRTWQVTGLIDGRVHLVAEDGATGCVLAAHLVSAPGFSVTGPAAAEPPAPALWETVPLAAQERALAWLRHIREVETGLPGGAASGGTPRPEYDPARRSMAEREQAKADELARLGWPQVSRATVRRMRARYHASGLLGLVPRRKPSRATGRADERVVAAVLEALRRQRGRSTGTLKGLRELTGQILADTHRPGTVALPPPSTFNRLVRVLADPLEHPGRLARTATTTPVWPYTPTVALRPGELVQVDTTRLDVMAVGEDGKPVRPELTIALDVATRSVVAAVLREEGTKAVDAALLLAEMAVPHPARPGWPGHLRLAHAAVPYDRLLALDARLEQAAARPVVVPETIVIDRGAIFVSAAFLAACETLGVSVQPTPPRSPAAKGAVERTFGSINTLVAQHIAGYTGSHILERGKAAEDEARFTVAQLQELLDEWVTARWQHRPHEGLRHPVLPKKALTPNEMWGALLGASGYVPLPLAGADYLELLPVRFHPITGRGIRINHRTYDHAVLNEPLPHRPTRRQVGGPPQPARRAADLHPPARRTPARNPVDPPRPRPRPHGRDRLASHPRRPGPARRPRGTRGRPRRRRRPGPAPQPPPDQERASGCQPVPDCGLPAGNTAGSASRPGPGGQSRRRRSQRP